MLNLNQTVKSIKAVTVCVNYSDYLKLSINNRQYLDDWVIVTSAEDHATIELCERENIRCTISNRLYQNGDVFNKAKALNDGFAAIKNPDWLLSLDADILLPNDFRNIRRFLFNKEYLYGIPRYTSTLYKLREYLQGKIGFPVLERMPIMPMILKGDWGTNRIIGYFQLFHYSQVNPQCIFPECYNDDVGNCNNAAFYDDVFSSYFINRQMYIEEIKAVHLPHDLVGNWNGRKSSKLPNLYMNTRLLL